MAKITYGTLVRKLYDHLFSTSFSKKRLKVLDCLDLLGKGCGGSIYHDNYSELFPKLVFNRDNHEYHMIVTPSYSGLDTFRLAFIYGGNDPRFRKFPFPHLTVYSRTIMNNIFANPNMKSLTSNDEIFASRFIASCPEEIALDAVFTPLSKEYFFKLYYLFSRNDLYFSSQGSRAMVRKEVDLSVLLNESVMKEFIERGDLFFQALYNNHCSLTQEADPSEWIKWVGIETGAARCTICGEKIYFSRVLCSECDTPHHLDCWKYNGCCSVYGCGSRNYYFPMS
jgi:hypothetical protein